MADGKRLRENVEATPPMRVLRYLDNPVSLRVAEEGTRCTATKDARRRPGR